MGVNKNRSWQIESMLPEYTPGRALGFRLKVVKIGQLFSKISQNQLAT
jgi:hypothetical protein